MNAGTKIWRKSSYSAHETDCVEVAGVGTVTALRDSKDANRGQLELGPTTWEAFLTRLGR